MVKGFFYILLFYFLGEALSSFTGNFIPGSVIGMILLFLSLLFRVVSPWSVRQTATVITKNMTLFFIPPAVGLMAYATYLSNAFWTILLSIILSTVLTIAAVSITQEYLEKKSKRKEKIS